jgi:hypothetical protein
MHFTKDMEQHLALYYFILFLRGYVRMLPLKWHLQRSESTFCKKFQVFKTLI